MSARASRTYIAGFGTTGLLVGSALLLLAVVSALVAFKGWPDPAIPSGVSDLVVRDADRPTSVEGPARVAVDAAPAAAAVAAAPVPDSLLAGAGHGSPVGGGTGNLASGGGGTGESTLGTLPRRRPASSPGRGAPPASGGGSGTPSLQRPPAPDPTRGVGGVTGGLGDTTHGVTQGLGQVVGGVSPSLGQTVTDTGEALSELVSGLGAPR